jgi:hypothetical protein
MGMVSYKHTNGEGNHPSPLGSRLDGSGERAGSNAALSHMHLHNIWEHPLRDSFCAGLICQRRQRVFTHESQGLSHKHIWTSVQKAAASVSPAKTVRRRTATIMVWWMCFYLKWIMATTYILLCRMCCCELLVSYDLPVWCKLCDLAVIEYSHVGLLSCA